MVRNDGRLLLFLAAKRLTLGAIGRLWRIIRRRSGAKNPLYEIDEVARNQIVFICKGGNLRTLVLRREWSHE